MKALGPCTDNIVHTVFVVMALLFWSCDDEPVVIADPEEYNEIRLMTFNVLYTTSNESVISTIRQCGADIIGLQEISKPRIADLQQKLGYYYHSFQKTSANMSDQDTGILSRFKIVRNLNNGVVFQINPSLRAALFTVHLSPYPYQPYDFRDGRITTESQAIAGASFRLNEINPVLDEMTSISKEGIPVFLTGDFNEPSHLDWTAETAAINLHFKQIVAWPVSSAVVAAGFVDAYRLQHANPANFPGNTWTTVESPQEVYDRIDLIYHSVSDAFTLQDIRLVGGIGDSAGITIDEYASDHYAVMATYTLQ